MFKKTAQLVRDGFPYVYMLAIILGYFTLLMDPWPESENQNIKMIAKQSFEKCLYQRDESEFKALYIEVHQFDPNFKRFCDELKYEMYQNPVKVGETLKWVREVEEETRKRSTSASTPTLVAATISPPELWILREG